MTRHSPAIALSALVALLSQVGCQRVLNPTPVDSPFYHLQAEVLNGPKVSMGRYRGKVLLVGNIASEDHFAHQLDELQELYEAHREKGLVVLGFPSDDFQGGEPRTNDELKKHLARKGITFPVFAKTHVVGPDIHPVFQWLTTSSDKRHIKGAVKWHYNKFLLDKFGRLRNRYATVMGPDHEKVQADIADLLKDAQTYP